jgi:AraC-like DNA-binding protein
VIVEGSYIRSTSLIGFSDIVETFGGDALSLLDEAGIPRSTLTDVDGLMSYRRFALLLEISAHRLNQPSFGLEWSLSSPAHFPGLGPLALMASFVKTVDEWIAMALQYWRFHTDAFTMQLIVGEDTAVFRYVADSFALEGRQISELVLGNLCMMSRKVTGHEAMNPLVIRFQHRRPKSISAHEAVFRCPVEFDAAHTEIVFDPAILKYKTNGNFRLFKSLVGAYIRVRIDRMPVYDTSMSATVALAIPSIIGTGRCEMEYIAEVLELHPKRLQRLLTQEGATYSEILEKVRENMARRLLVESNASVERIAGLLDYSGTAPFTTAFKRWSGQTPLAFRKTERVQRLASARVGQDPV